MKKCPTCQKTFEDNLRFCQLDGTPLVDDAPDFDPYATIVSSSISAPEVSAQTSEEREVLDQDEAPLHQTVGSLPISPPDDILEVPQNDPLKTMYASDDEMKEILSDVKDEPASSSGHADAVDQEADVPWSDEPESPLAEPERSATDFTASDPPAASFGDMAPPPSPFSGAETVVDVPPAAPPPPEDVPAPFSEADRFDEAATMLQPQMSGGFNPDPPAAPVPEWAPPPVPDASWQNQQVGSNAPLQSQAAGVAGQNKTLAIISLVLGIAGLTVCCGGFLPSLAAIITGFMARSKATQDPQSFGGAGMAMAGLVMGAIGFVGGVLIWILYGGLILSGGRF